LLCRVHNTGPWMDVDCYRAPSNKLFACGRSKANDHPLSAWPRTRLAQTERAYDKVIIIIRGFCKRFPERRLRTKKRTGINNTMSAFLGIVSFPNRLCPRHARITLSIVYGEAAQGPQNSKLGVSLCFRTVASPKSKNCFQTHLKPCTRAGFEDTILDCHVLPSQIS
jgi:hypothetical protein